MAKLFQARVAEAIKNAFDSDTFYKFLLNYFEDEADNFNGSKASFEMRVLELAHRVKKARALARLLDALCDERPTDEAFQQLKRELAPLETNGADPYDEVFLFGQMPLLDRKDFRNFARRLEHNKQPRVVVVHGEPKTGKTRTAEFIRHIHENRGGFKLHWIDLELEFRSPEEPDRTVTARDLAKAINDKLGLGHTFASDPAADVFKIQPFSNTFSRELKSTGEDSQTHHVIIIDSFSKRSREDAVDELLRSLARLVARELDSVFLVLLDFESKLPNQIEPHVYREKTEPLRDPQDIAEFFDALLRATGPLASESESALRVAAAVAQATRGIDLPALKSMKTLGDNVLALAHQIRSGEWDHVGP